MWNDVSEKVVQKREAVGSGWRDDPTQDLVWADGCQARPEDSYVLIQKWTRASGHF